jgi:hypothetical protein
MWLVVVVLAVIGVQFLESHLVAEQVQNLF